MKTKYFFILLILSALTINSFAQSVSFADDDLQRGYYTRPYLRYEAESGKCSTNAAFLPVSFDQTTLQSEATNQQALQLTAQNHFVEWTNSQVADGLTIRFSLPDNATGTGTKDTLALLVNGEFAAFVPLDSYWAWQYFYKTMSPVYPDNTPAANKFPRMRFDETHVKLATKIPENATFRLVKKNANDIVCTIDFVELEDVPPALTFDEIADVNKVQYTSANGSLQSFILSNLGKTIFLPAGRYLSDKRLNLNADSTKLIGAGMWYSEIFFTASSDDRGTYNQRGIESSRNNIVIDGIFLNTINNKRYYDNNDSYQVGKGFMGSFGSNSIIKNVWVEHFECGAWIEAAQNLTLTDCRFRNNYADGINFCYGTKNSTFEKASLRNNGDDDLATWSRSNQTCENNTFAYCTAENNWRASSLGFFGGKQNSAHHILIIDPMEAGFRVTCDFPGASFSTVGFSEMHDISVYNGGAQNGINGTRGDLWGNQQGALHLNSSSQYDLQNIKISNIDLYNSKFNALYIGSTSKFIRNLILENIYIHSAGNFGAYFSGTKGDAQYCNIVYANIGAANNTNTVPSAFSFTQSAECVSAVNNYTLPTFKVSSDKGQITISEIEPSDTISVFDILGRSIFCKNNAPETLEIRLNSGIYLVKNNDGQAQKVMVF